MAEKKAKVKGGKSKGKKTEPLPGIPTNTIKEVSDAMEQYQEIKLARVSMLAQENDANKYLGELMAKHKLTTYRDDDFDPPLVAKIGPTDPTPKVTVKAEKPKKAKED